MKHLLYAGLTAIVIAFGACNKDSVNQPVVPSRQVSMTDAAGQLSLSKAQLGEIVDMFYLDEDMSAIMPGDMSTHFDDLIKAGCKGYRDEDEHHARVYYDIAAMLFYRAALEANADLTDQQKAALDSVIRQSNAARLAIASDPSVDAAARIVLLNAEHDKLMAAIIGTGGQPGILTAAQVQKTEDLLAQIEQARAQRHAQMLQLRIQWQIAHWDAVLALTDSQKIRISALLVAQDSAVQAARTQYASDPEQFRAVVLSIHQQTRDAIRALLDPNQQILWDKMIAQKSVERRHKDEGDDDDNDGGGSHGRDHGKHHGG